MTADRIAEFQKVALVAQQQHLDSALATLRQHASELELQREHNATLFALLLQRDRQLQAVRAELMQVRGVLGEELR